MARVGVEVIGLNQLVRFLRTLEPELHDGLKEANAALSDEIAADARHGAPRQSGRLAGTVRSSGTARTGIVRAGGARVPWTGPVHFGWAARNIEPNKFLYRAFDAREDEITQRYLEALEQIVRAAA